jgi:hypothetical protein
MLSEWSAECSHDAPTLVVPWSEDPADPTRGAHFVDLRAHPYDIAEIREAELYPALGRALRSLNAARSPFLTAKCDAWASTPDDWESACAAAESTRGGPPLADTAPNPETSPPPGPETEARHTFEPDVPPSSEPEPDAGHEADRAPSLEALRLELMLPPEEAAFSFASYIDLLWRERSVFASAHHQQDRLDRISRRAQRLPHPEAALHCVLRPALLDLNGPLEGFAVTLYVTALGPEPEIARRRWELALDDVVTLLRSKELQSARGSATIDATDAYPLRVRHLG